jgi:hypothetical protein
MIKRTASGALSNQDLMNLFDAYETVLSNRALSPAGLAIGSASAAKVKIVNTVTYLSDDVFKSKTTAEVAFTATTHDIPPHATLVQEAVYLVCLAADGTPSLTMGDIASGAGLATLPERPATGTPIGYVRVAVAAGATLFDASTDLLSAAHITDTYVDLGNYGGRFDVAQ